MKIWMSLMLLLSTVTSAALSREVAIPVGDRFGLPQESPTDLYVNPEQRPGPLMIILQGARVDKKHYAMLASALVSWDGVVAVPNHKSYLGQHFTEQRVVNHVWDYLRSHDSYRQYLTGELVVLGHSFAGVAVFNLAQGRCGFPTCVGSLQPPKEMRAVISYGYFRKKAMESRVPILMIQGSLDNLQDAKDTFQLIEAPNKSFVEISGANHYGLTNTNNPEGAKKDDAAPEISQKESIEQVALAIRGFIESL